MHPDSHPAEDTNDPMAVENAIFETALQLADPDQRRAFLERTFQGDPQGRREMEELVELAGTSSAFFLESRLHAAELAQEVIEEIPGGTPRAESGASCGESEGANIGRYTLLRKIGEGGVGEIFEARQEGMARTVALKIIRSGMDTEAVVSRFEAERQALELMEHPNIARVLDAGRTERGRPYFVMELVRGSRITAYCESERLDVRARLELILKVCQAIQHAHQKGIVHRDIKPSNILVESVDGTPLPKVIDFGIAKAMEGANRPRPGITQVGQFIGTPAYMSPEQIDMGGRDIDTRADIYGIGALLYELLAGRPPFDTEQLLECGVVEMRRVLIEDNPPLPSEAARQPCDGGRALPAPREKWAAALRGDLDWIVFKAMEKERNRRYQTANSLAMDLRRFLDNEPVLARKPSRGYFMWKFFQRNRAACVLGLAMLLTLVAGLGLTTMLYFREKEALAEQARLQRQAQARANVSRAVFLVSEGKTAEADRLLRENPLESIDVSPEAAEVFRSLGRWNATFGRWRQAADCFRLMNEATRLGDRAKMLETVDLLMTAPSYLEAGDRKAYEALRAEMLQRYVPAQNGLQAERLLKACLLLPVDQRTIGMLESTAQVCRESPSGGGTDGIVEWKALSLALFHYRKGDFREAIREADRCIAIKDKAGSRESAARCVLALSRFKLGETREARSQLAQAKVAIQRVESQIDESGFPPIGNWFAWSVVRILIREADDLFD
jgi:serine/threonine protein kinase